MDTFKSLNYLAQGDIPYGELPHYKIRSAFPLVHSVADAFYQNFGRARNASCVLSEAVVVSAHYKDCEREAARRLGIDYDKGLTAIERDLVHSKWFEVFNELMDDAQANPEQHLKEGKQIAGRFFWLADRAETMRERLTIPLASTLIHAWTAFETAAGDLWEQSLNTCPEPWAIAALSAEPDTRGESFGALSNFIHDLIVDRETDRPGSLIRRAGKYNLQIFPGIIRAYVAVFGKDAKSLFQKEPFRLLQVLCAIRNLLVHRAGLVDRQFLDAADEFSEEFKHCGIEAPELGRPLAIEGLMVSKLILATSVATAELFKFIEEILQRSVSGSESGRRPRRRKKAKM
jgi:hypothetical protein